MPKKSNIQRKKFYKLGQAPDPVKWPQGETEYNDPNVPPINVEAVKNTTVQTILDQYNFGKLYNASNTASTVFKNSNLPNYGNAALEVIKLGTGPIADGAANYLQEGLESYNKPQQSYGLPGNAYTPPGVKPRTIPQYTVPTSSTTHVAKPIKQLGKGGPISKLDDPSYAAMAKVVTERNKQLPWVDRALNPAAYPVTNQEEFMDGPKKMTHRLSYSTGDQGDAYVTPDIGYNNGKLSWDYNQTPIKFNSAKMAEYYSKNGLIKHSKGGPLRKFEGGGNTINGVTYDWTGLPVNNQGQEVGDYMGSMSQDSPQWGVPKSSTQGGSGLMGAGTTPAVDYAKQGQASSGGFSGMKLVDAGIQLGSAYAIRQATNHKNPNYVADGQNQTVGTARGISTGWSVGNSIYPGIGGIVGAFAGGIYGAVSGNKKDKQYKRDLGAANTQFKDARRLEMESRAALMKEQSQGYGTQMYEDGGPLPAKGALASKYLKAHGGNLKQLSNSTVEVQGPSHGNGGVGLPQLGAEVEGKETISDGYVFSEELGFAKVHKKIAKATGIIEAKPATPERLNTLKLLKEKENKLALAQEYIRKTLNQDHA